MNLDDLFASKSFRIRHRDSGKEYDAVKLESKISKMTLSCCDKPSYKDVERDIVDPKTMKKVDRVKDRAKCFEFTADASSDSHGGTISAEAGDYLIREGHSFFVVPDVDRRTRRPIFDTKYVKV